MCQGGVSLASAGYGFNGPNISCQSRKYIQFNVLKILFLCVSRVIFVCLVCVCASCVHGMVRLAVSIVVLFLGEQQCGDQISLADAVPAQRRGLVSEKVRESVSQ